MTLGIKSKLLVMLLCVSIASISIVSVLSYFRSRDALSDSVTAQLRSTQASLAEQVESYFETIRGQGVTLSEDRAIIEATLEFRVGWDQLDDAEIDDDQARALADTYQEFAADLPAADLASVDDPATFEPEVPNARYLQSEYLVDATNDPEIDEPSELDDAGDGSFYSRAHQRYHPALRNFVEQFGYYDLFLIDAETGDIMYSVAKEIDFATNLVTGPHRNTNLARLVDEIRADPQPGEARFVDYRFYAPSRQAPAAFVAAPIISPVTGAAVGILALQLPVDRIDAIVNVDQAWNERGLGETGESYLVGADLLMRSTARPLVEEPERYLERIEGDVDPDARALIDEYDSTTLLQPVDTAAARLALDGQSGIRVDDDYLGRETLSAYAPLDLAGLRWAIVTQFELDEANAPVNDLQRQLLIATGIIVLLLTVLAMALSAIFVRPINGLIRWADAVRSGDLEHEVDVSRRDEFGELGQAFEQVVATLRSQSDVMADQNAENEALLLTIMPPEIAERLKAGERRIADEYPNASVVHAQITGFDAFTSTASAGAAVDVLNDVAAGADEVAARHGMEQISLSGGHYVAACGLLQPRLDHQRRAVEFALDLRAFVLAYSSQNATTLGGGIDLAVGVASGEVEAGVIGRERPGFAVWGSTVTGADVLADSAAPGEVMVGSNVAEHLEGQFDFGAARTVDVGYLHVDACSVEGRTPRHRTGSDGPERLDEKIDSQIDGQVEGEADGQIDEQADEATADAASVSDADRREARR